MTITNNTIRYHSFSELPGFSKTKKVNNHVNPEGQKKFSGTCRVCGKPLSYIDGTNVMVCSNPECKGGGKRDDEYIPIYRCLNSKSTKIAKKIFNGDNI